VRTSRVLLSLLAATAVVVPVYAAEIWAVDNLGANNVPGLIGDRVIRFDSADPLGTVTTIGATGVVGRNMSGLDFSGAGVLYAASGFGSAFPGSELFTISTVDGSATPIGSLGLPAGTAVTDLSWNPVTGKMQALTSAGGGGAQSIYEVALNNGAATLVGQITGLPAGALLIGMSTDSAGVNYVHNLADDRMYKLTGLAAAPMSAGIGIDTNFSQGMVMDWRANNEWYLGSISANPVLASQVRLMDNTTGGTTSILATWPNNGANGLPQYETADLAIVPEPGSLCLLGLAALGLAAARRR
jgi:hypothetical protein